MESPENETTTTTTTTTTTSPSDAVEIQHYNMHRRFLQFEEARRNTTSNSSGFWSPSNITSSSALYASSADSKIYESSCLEVREISIGRQLSNLKQPISPRNSGNSTPTISTPSGIGLHLNSIISAMPNGCDATGSMKSAEKGYLNIEGRKLISIMDCHRPEKTNKSTVLSNVGERVSASSEDGRHETQSPVATSSLASLSPQIVKSLSDVTLLKGSEYQTNPCDKRKSIYEHDDAVEEFNPSSPKKKRKKASTSDDGDGCKRCNCKKTKCLKLYCDCFAAGIYCAEPCSCQGCFNRPEYEDTVLETRQQIESRNPLAFAPKIVTRITESPANSNWGDGNNLTPSSARHKRGCNCKKSLCLKRYCECYQANVGCSNGCRCEGCKNVYGRKEDCGVTIDVFSKQLENTFDEKLEMTATLDSLLPNELCNPHNFTPLTPSFQFSDHGKDASKSWFSARRCLPSPESNMTFLPQCGKSSGSPGNSNNHDKLLKDRTEVEDVVSCHQDYGNVEATAGFSPRYAGFANLCDLSTLPNLSCPITPVAQFGATKFVQAVDSVEKLHDIPDDDMPDILKDNSCPLNVVKVSSPNKKRISPPRSSLQELGSGSSVGLRSGRKFILQAVPLFPSLTSCIASKDSSSQNLNNPQNGI